MNASASRNLVAGIFVGGKARRMGGAPKGLLAHPSRPGTLIDHLASVASEIGATPVIVGAHPDYAQLGLDIIEDAVPDIGPAGGLLGLLRSVPHGIVLAIANDLPFLTRELLDTLLARFADDMPALIPQRADRLEPLCAVYRPALMLPHVEAAVRGGVYGLHRIARAAGASVLPLDAALSRCLDDWDTPQDVGRARS